MLNYWKILSVLLADFAETLTLCEKCPYSEFFWSIFSRVPTEYGDILRICPYSVRMQENTDLKNPEYGRF